jgi:fatty-acyl-CoA synthase
VDVAVGEDKVHGALARITVEAAPGADPAVVSARVRELLARYTVRYELDIR